MPEPILSRRTFLAAAGVGTAALMSGCAASTLTKPPATSPAAAGSYETGQLILGETAGTTALPQPLTPGQLPPNPYDFSINYNQICQGGQPVDAPLPTSVKAAVYYPTFAGTDHRVPTPNPLSMPKGPFPVLLYAHAFRNTHFACTDLDPHQDLKSVEFMLRHVASYGCVCVVPDLSWLPGSDWVIDGQPVSNGIFTVRGLVLVNYYAYLAALNDTLFARQLDLSRVVLVGHSNGGGGAVYAGRLIAGFSHPQSLSYGLIAPVLGAISSSPAGVNSNVRNLLALYGTLDSFGVEGAPPTYAAGGTPKTLVAIGGANHFGFTSLCDANNSCPTSAGVFDVDGMIMRDDQQQAGAAYLAALVRYYALGDNTARPYLTGEKAVEGLKVTDIQVQAEGYPLPKGPLPTLGPNR